MTFDELITEIKTMADPRALASWQRLNLQSKDEYLGTGMTKLKERAKKIKKDHGLAMQCWRSNIHDAKMMACFIDEPKKISPEDADEVIHAIDIWGLGDQYIKIQLIKTSFSVAKAEQWANNPDEFVRRAGYQLVQLLAKDDDELPDSWFENYLGHIENLQNEPNWVKEMMAYALISIGVKNPELHQKAWDIAKNLGPVEVDYGDTSCKSPDPLATLERKNW